MTTLTELRLRLLENGYTPLPALGKRVLLPGWTTLDINAAEIASWEQHPEWPNTGVRASALDADVKDPEAAEALRQAINDWLGERGHVLRRIGEAPKFLVPLRVTSPFPKVRHEFRAPNGAIAAIEFLCGGQQYIAAGMHPDTREPYTWCDGRDLTNTPCDALPEIDKEEAHELVQRLGDLLVEEYGYKRTEGAPKANGHAAADTPRTGGGTDYAERLRTAADGAAVNDAQSKRIFSLLNRGEHPDEVEQIVLGETLAAKAWDTLSWTEKRELTFIRGRIRSGLRKLSGEYAQGTGEVPPWLHDAFHLDWCRIIADGGWPSLIRPGHHCKVVDTKPKAADDTESGAARAIPLTAEEWLKRSLPPFDCLMGDWLTTTSRILFSADTGIGKSSFWLAVLAGCAHGVSFLHWRCHRPARVLFVDGEMSRQWLQKMIRDATRRLGAVPSTLLFLSREDYPNMPPLNTPEGKAFILAYIEATGGVDIVVFDNLMSLLVGELREPASWQNVLKLVAELSRRNIGQVWINHTGHDTGRSYGDKTRDWRMTSTVHLTKVERPDTDVSFELKFGKKRECTPLNRADFQTVKVALVKDAWVGSAAVTNQAPPKPGTVEAKCLDLLHDVLNDDDSVTEHADGRRTVSSKLWFARCRKAGACTAANEHSTQTIFDRTKRKLVSRNMIGCNGDQTWLL